MQGQDKERIAPKPVARFRYGGVTASVFSNLSERGDGTRFETRRTVLQRTYVDDAGQFKTTSSFDVRDLPKAVLALTDAYRFCVTSREPGDEDEP